MGARKKLVLDRCQMEKGVGCECELDFKFFAPNHYLVLDSVWCQMVLDMVLDRCQKKMVLDRCLMGKGAGCQRKCEWRTRA